jgi:hypothetical protein
MSHTSLQSSPTTHDEHGYFAAGNRGGPGNPCCRQVAALRAGLLAAVTQQDIQDVIAALLVQAQKGNVAAARLFLAYTIGKPADSGRAAVNAAQEQMPQTVSGERTSALSADVSAAVPGAGPASRGPLGSPTEEAEPPVRLNARARAEIRRAERKRRKAERKKARRLELQAARLQDHRGAAPTANAPIGPRAPSPIGSNGPVLLSNSV